MLFLESVTEKQETTVTPPPGDIDMAAAIFGSLFYHEEAGTAK